MEKIEDIIEFLKIEFDLEEEDLKEIIEDFFDLLDTGIDDLKKNIEENNIEEIKKELHSIKGAALNMGAKALGENLTEWELLIKEEKQYDPNNQLNKVVEIIKNFKG